MTAVIPALDEEASIGAVLDAIPHDIVSEIVVVDGGSRDRTVAVARERGARIVQQEERGYGAACQAGAGIASGAILVFLDADGAADPLDIPRLVAPVRGDAADMVLGSRLARTLPRGAMPWHQEIGNRLCARLIHLLYGHRITDLGPFRAVRRARLDEIDLRDRTYGWPTEMIVRGARAGWRIQEVPVCCRPRSAGRSKISGTVGGTLFATGRILATILRYARA